MTQPTMLIPNPIAMPVEAPRTPVNIDPSIVTMSFNRLTPRADWVSKYFYAHLFKYHPEMRSLFPEKMDVQRDRFVMALVRIVGDIEHFDNAVGYLERLGRGHQRRLGVLPEHYPAVGDSLIATLRHFSGAMWTPEIERNWMAAYDLISQVMIAAAEEHGSDLADDEQESFHQDGSSPAAHGCPVAPRNATRRGLRLL